ncbi:MAG: hypothetical protein C0467_12935 [Planctomycetaceae bacterium]|nr:hypothetical protein [Planctomycetaceae bacterium]
MTFTLLMIGGAVATAVVFAVQPVEYDKPVAIPTEPVEITGGTALPKPPEWHVKTFVSLNAAQEMLDHLEAQGIAEREFVVVGNASFVVRWK